MQKALLGAAELILRSTTAAWRRLAARGAEFGDLRTQLRLLHEENARLRAESELLRARMRLLDPPSRPHYSRPARFDILFFIRRWGLSQGDAARTFVVARSTLSRWFKLQKIGDAKLAGPRRAVNRLSDLTRELVDRLRAEQADWGSQRICDVLAKLGVRISRRSVQRIKREGPSRRPRPLPDRSSVGRPVRAKYPQNVWLTDLTSVSLLGLRTIWIGAIVDVFSRKVLAIRAWAKTPTGSDVRLLLKEAIALFGAPKYLVTDRGCQFVADCVSRLLRRRGVRRRYGAVARWQSVAIIDRFFESLKREYASRWIVLLPLERANAALVRYGEWFGRRRPHQGLGGRTPDEVFFRKRRRLRPGTLRDVRLSHSHEDPRLPFYRRMLAA